MQNMSGYIIAETAHNVDVSIAEVLLRHSDTWEKLNIIATKENEKLYTR
jgi:hypothetical protein